MKLRKLTQEELFQNFKEKTKSNQLPKSAIYKNQEPSYVRAVAEFEEMGGVLIAYPGTVAQESKHIQLPPTGKRSFGIPNELIVRMQQADTNNPVQIFIMCADQTQLPLIIADLNNTAIKLKLKFDPNLITLVDWDTDTFWTRDYGPWWVENSSTGYFGIAKHLYTSLGGGSVGLVEGAENVDPNDPNKDRAGHGIFRPNDDYGADKLSDMLNTPIRKWNKENPDKEIKVHNWYNTGLLDVGGNYMVNGQGKVASSYLVATQNELPTSDEKFLTNPTNEVIAQRMKYVLSQLNQFMGINSYHVLSDPTGTYIGHIDCWGKFLDVNKVVVAKSQDENTNKAFDNIAKSFEKDGFEVFRLMCQNVQINYPQKQETTAAYTNCLILNKYVYVPMAGKGYEQFDKEAIELYQEAMPGYTVIGINGKTDYPWLGTDAMHCRTRAIPRKVVENWKEATELLKSKMVLI